jgi:cell division protein FtsN
MALKNRRLFELRLGKLGLALFVGGMSLLLFCFFLVGVFIGKNMEAYPERYASGLPGMIGERWFAAAPQPEKAEPPPPEQTKGEEPAAGEAEFGLTFYDTLGGPKGGTAAGRAKGKTSEMAGGQEASAGNGPGSASSPSIPGTTVARGPLAGPAGEGEAKRSNPPAEKAPAAEAKKQPPPERETATRSKEHFEVQVAAYREKRQAEQMVQKFASLGFSPQVVMKEFPDSGRWFRVVVVGFESRESAQKAADRMTGKVRGLKCVIRASEK